MSATADRDRFARQMLPHLDAAYALAYWLTRNEDEARVSMLRVRNVDRAPRFVPRSCAFLWRRRLRQHSALKTARECTVLVLRRRRAHGRGGRRRFFT